MTSTDDLCEWVEQQPAWQQDLARRLLLRSQLDGDGYDEALAVVLAAHHALDPDERAPNPQGVVLEDFPVAAQAGDTPRLISFGRVRGVGALSGADELRFAPSGITVVFGANAAGKSTFVGALKVICRAVDRHNVLRGNVFAEDPEEQVASLETVTGAAEPVARRVDLRDPQEPQMSSISVFDSGCAELYIDSENAIAFVPSALLLLARLHPTQNRMRVNIEARLARARGRMPQFTDIAQGTDARRRMDYLSPSTDLDELREAVTLTEAESRRFDVLRAATAAADANETEQNANAASREADLATTLVAALGALTEALSEQRAKRLAALAVEADQAKAAVETATAQFAGLPIQGVGGEAWQRMWEAARNFAAAAPAPSAFPPIASSPCPLCLQPLSSAAADNLGHLEAHVHSTLSEQSQAADLALTQALGELDERKVAQCRGGFLAALREGDSELADSIESFLQSAAARMTTMLSAPKSAEAVPPVVSNPRQQLSEWAAGRTQRAVILRASAQPEEAAQLRAELSELEARNNVASRMEEVVAAVAERARIAGLEAAFSDLNTNRVSRCQRELAESAVTRALEAKLIEEMGALGCGYVRAELRARGAGGETIIGLQLVGANGAPAVSEVLSEGEQGALSLAFFLAEVGTAEHDGGIILDDPVSSLDDQRRAYIARRLVEEAQHRQVIVFTHDMHLVADLSDQAKKRTVPIENQWVWRDGEEPGRVDVDPPFNAKNVRARVGALATRIQEWDNQPAPGNQDEALRRVTDVYRGMRTTWERGVEERLFRGVVQRFQREVKTMSLAQVEITQEMKDVVESGMTRCSTFLHDAAEGTLPSIPGRAELSVDFAVLAQFERDTRQP